jgi:hypothetical protein
MIIFCRILPAKILSFGKFIVNNSNEKAVSTPPKKTNLLTNTLSDVPPESILKTVQNVIEKAKKPNSLLVFCFGLRNKIISPNRDIEMLQMIVIVRSVSMSYIKHSRESVAKDIIKRRLMSNSQKTCMICQ